MILFSIIIPIYNTSAYLRECLDSVLLQSFTDYEAILVNDGSTDDSLMICEEYLAKDNRFRLVNKANGGLVSARIAGANEVRGVYCICLDSDDWMESHYLELIANCINQYNKPDMVIMGHIYAFGQNHKPQRISLRTGYYREQQMVEEIYPILMRRNDDACMPGQLWAKAFKSDIYIQQQQQVGLFLKIGEDKACSIACMRYAKTAAIMDYCGYYYRMNPFSITKNRKAFPWNGPELIGRHLEKQIDMSEYNFKEQLYRFVTHEVAIVAASQFFSKKKYREVCKELNKELSKPYYASAIEHAVYRKNLMAIGMRYALKYRLYFFLYLYNKLFQKV